MDPTQNPAGNDPAATATDDSKEWDQAGLDFLADRGVEPVKNQEEQGAIENEQTKPKEGDEGKKTPEANPEGKKPNEEPGNGDDPQKGTGTAEEAGKPTGSETEEPPRQTPEQEEAARRRSLLELDADRKELATDVRKEMFSDVPTRLEDADGDPIETIADVMRLTNPRTGKPFTAEEASQWLMQATRHVEKQQEATQKQVDEIVDVNLRIKQEADSVKSKYGQLLAHMPKLRARVWAQYKATLQTHEGSDIITKAPISMEDFYDTILAPYQRQVEDMKKNAEVDKQKQEENEKRKKEAEEKKKRSQGDREDVFSTRTKIEDISDPEEKEWAQAAKEYYED